MKKEVYNFIQEAHKGQLSDKEIKDLAEKKGSYWTYNELLDYIKEDDPNFTKEKLDKAIKDKSGVLQLEEDLFFFYI